MNADLQAYTDILKFIGIIIITLSSAFLLIKFTLYRTKVDKRTELINGSTKIMLGAFLIGTMVTIGGFFQGYISNISTGLSNSDISASDIQFNTSLTDTHTFFSKSIAEILDSLTNFIFSDDNTVKESILGTKTMEQLIFPDNANIYSDNEWNNLLFGYKCTSIIGVILIITMVFTTGVKFIKGSTNEKVATEAKEDLKRWFYVALIIASGPLLIKGTFTLFTWLSTLLNDAYTHASISDGILKDLTTGNILTTAIVKLYFAYLTFKINIVFMIRKWVLAVMVVFTPIAAGLWGISPRTRGFSVWVGELTSNAAMGLAYLLTYLGFSALMIETPSVLELLVGLTLMIKLAGVLRNSLQGLLTQYSGADEEGIMEGTSKAIVGGAVSAAAMLMGGAGKAYGQTKNLNGNGANKDMFNNMGREMGKQIFNDKDSPKKNNMAQDLNKKNDKNNENMQDMNSEDRANNMPSFEDQFRNAIEKFNAGDDSMNGNNNIDSNSNDDTNNNSGDALDSYNQNDNSEDNFNSGNIGDNNLAKDIDTEGSKAELNGVKDRNNDDNSADNYFDSGNIGDNPLIDGNTPGLDMPGYGEGETANIQRKEGITHNSDTENKNNSEQNSKNAILEKAIQGMFFDNLSQQRGYGSGKGIQPISNSLNRHQVVEAQEKTIGDMANIMMKKDSSLTETAAKSKATEMFDKGMFREGTTEHDKKEFVRDLARGEAGKAAIHLANSKRTEDITGLFERNLT